MNQPTTALRKIAALKKPTRIIQGGQGAGKTISLLDLCINHAASNQGREIIIASAELTKMRLTVIKDFVKRMKHYGIYMASAFKSGTFYRFPSGSFIKFIGMDKADIGKGFRCDIFYLNEANKIPFGTYDEFAARARIILMDFNPNVKFWVHEEVMPYEDHDHIILTYRDNEYLPDYEKKKIEAYFKKAYGIDYDGRPPSEYPEQLNKYWANKWRVYGLGLIGRPEGVVFERWEEVDTVPRDARLIGYGVDFGFANPAAVVAIYQMDGHYYLDEVAYSAGKSNEWIARKITEAGMASVVGYADSAEPKSIRKICDCGVNLKPCDSKSDIRDYGIDELNERVFFVTKSSESLKSELLSYRWEIDRSGTPTGRPVKKNDHGVDAVIYFLGSHGKYDGEYSVY